MLLSAVSIILFTMKPILWLILTSLLLCFAGAPADALEVEWTLISNSSGGAKGAVQLTSGELLSTRSVWRNAEHQVLCSRSLDGGETWEELSVIARQEGRATVGDGHLLQLPSGEVLYSYRHNLLGETSADERAYSIQVAVSRDGGHSWKSHSTVATSSHDPAEEPGASRGLWSSFLFLTPDGGLHCVYDDEDTPHREGYWGHQWLTMRTWDERGGAWVNPVTVSRAHNPRHLSRDGMPSVARLPSGRLICVFETVQVTSPHANLIRSTTSDNGGKSWSWEREERGLVFKPSKADHLAMSPWLIRLASGELICVFATDEDRAIPGVSGRPPSEYRMDVKYVLSVNGGDTWSSSGEMVFDTTHRNYMPGIIELEDRSLLIAFFDHAQGDFRAVRGEQTTF